MGFAPVANLNVSLVAEAVASFLVTPQMETAHLLQDSLKRSQDITMMQEKFAAEGLKAGLEFT
jgi:hypothetical protein